MAGDSRQVLNVKRKMYSWVMSFLGDSNFPASEYAPSKQLVPDAKDIVGILKSAGFRLVDVTMGQLGGGAGASNNALCCRVVVTCAKSGLKAVLESEADCRCPADALGNGASAWCVMSPSGSQESLDKSWNVTASSLMPNVAPHVEEVVGAATRFLMQLLEDKGLVAATGAGAGTGRAVRTRGSMQDLARTPGFHGAPPPPAAAEATATDSPGSKPSRRTHNVWLEDMEWEAALRGFATTETALPDISGLSLSGSQSFSRSESQISQVGVIGPPRRQSSTLEDYALPVRTRAGVETKAIFDEHMRLIEKTRVLPPPSSALPATVAPPTTATTPLQKATITISTPAAATAAAAAAAAATSTTPPGADLPCSIAAEVPAPVVVPGGPTANTSSQQQANTLLPMRAQEALQQAEGFMQNMSRIMEMLKAWSMQIEDSAAPSESTDTNAQKAVPAPPPTAVPIPPTGKPRPPTSVRPQRSAAFASLASKMALARKSAQGGGTKVSTARSTPSRVPAAARGALRLRPPTTRPHAARVNAVAGTAERVVAARTTAKDQPPRPATPKTAGPPAGTSPTLVTAGPSGSPRVSPAGTVPPPPPPRRQSLDSPGNEAGLPSVAVASTPVAVASTVYVTRVVSSETVAAAGRTTSRSVPPSRTAPPPPPKPKLKRASK